MPASSIKRINEEISRELSSIIREMKDPRINTNLISIVKVETSSDLSISKVFLSSIEGLESAKNAEKVLKSASGYIKKELAQRVKLRKIPNINFKSTDSIEYASSISKILSEL